MKQSNKKIKFKIKQSRFFFMRNIDLLKYFEFKNESLFFLDFNQSYANFEF